MAIASHVVGKNNSQTSGHFSMISAIYCVAYASYMHSLENVVRENPIKSGWWFGTCFVFHILGNLSSQLTFIFFRGVGFNHKPEMIKHDKTIYHPTWKTHHLYIVFLGKAMVFPGVFRFFVARRIRNMDLLAQYSDSEGEVGMGLAAEKRISKGG